MSLLHDFTLGPNPFHWQAHPLPLLPRSLRKESTMFVYTRERKWYDRLKRLKRFWKTCRKSFAPRFQGSFPIWHLDNKHIWRCHTLSGYLNGFESHWVSPGSQGCHPGPERIFPGVKDADPSLLRLAVSRRFFPCSLFLSLHLATGHQHCITAFRRKRLEENDLLLPPSTPATPQNSFFQFTQFPILFSFCFLSPSHSLGLLLHRLTSWARISEKFDWGLNPQNIEEYNIAVPQRDALVTGVEYKRI